MSNEEQVEYWNGDAGERWAQEDDMMARLLRPVCEALLDHAAPESSESALDVGCGGGSQSLMLAQRLGAGSSVLGVDISGPMLEVAREKRDELDASDASLDFLQADASVHSFEQGTFDLLFSRFGVMFFEDPTAAFSHMRKALRPGAKLAFCCWQPLAENEWTLVPVQAALQHLPPPDMPDPHAPGPFAFADPQRVQDILQGAGFSDVEVAPYRSEISFQLGDSLQESVRKLAMIGPVNRLLIDQPADIVDKVISSMEEAMGPHYRDGALRMNSAIWFVTGRSD